MEEGTSKEPGYCANTEDYPDAFQFWNQLSSIGAYISFASTIFLFVLPQIYTLFWGKRVGANQWGEGATTLEWTVSSPPPFHTFEELPVIKPEAAH